MSISKFKKVLLGAALLTLTGGYASAQADELNLETPEGALAAARKVQCSTIDDKPETFYWYGRVYSRRMGERDKHLFNVEGMNIRSCRAIEDTERGLGYKLVSRELLLYKDPKTNEVLNKWENPWTGEEVQVLHVENDPVNQTQYVKTRSGDDLEFGGDILQDKFFMNITVPLFYPNPLAGDYQKEIGGTYHATEMFNFFGDTADLIDDTKDSTSVHVGWERISDWLPWMNMQGREGIIYMHTAGRKVDNFDDVGDTMKAEIKKNYPKYMTPPPGDDSRKNMTSWQYFKDVKEGKITLPER